MVFALFIDEEIEASKYYRMALEKSFSDVKHIKSTDEAIIFLISTKPSETNPQPKAKPDAIILDIMMPPGERYKNRPEVKRGLRTGILLYLDINEIYPDMPVIVLTNSAQGKAEFNEKYPDVPAYEKIELTPYELIKEIKTILGVE